MKTIELFAGTKSFTKVADRFGADSFTTDIQIVDGQDLIGDVRTLTTIPKAGMGMQYGDFPFKPDFLWASPPCEGFSVAVIGRNWNYDQTPKTDSAKLGMELVLKTLSLIRELRPKYWFIENPRGMLRKMRFMDEFLKEMNGVRHTVTYCQYGDTRMKPTDIWTNATWWNPKPPCKNGDSCHVSAPRGSATGTQGIKGQRNRARIPAGLFEEIFTQYHEHTSK